ncbi:MAG TPA: ADYC domain-containing protein [Stellaceae bacterium]|nr:ADYC domain-containing protein [Stellaceae bacterium]
MWLRSFLLAAGLVGAATLSAAAAEMVSVEADGTEFKVTMSSGAVLRSRDLAGAELTVRVHSREVVMRIDAVERDPDAKRGAVWLHTLSARAADGSWHNVCEAGPDGRRRAFPLAVRARPEGMFEDSDPTVFELTCTGGAIGKCVRFGYLPWPAGGDLALYNACVRMVRADYCGQGEGTTRNGMRIDLYDDAGIQKADNDPVQEFEAGWNAAGAVCVHHVRVKENTSLDALAKSCPRLREHLGPDCTEAGARASAPPCSTARRRRATGRL